MNTSGSKTRLRRISLATAAAAVGLAIVAGTALPASAAEHTGNSVSTSQSATASTPAAKPGPANGYRSTMLTVHNSTSGPIQVRLSNTVVEEPKDTSAASLDSDFPNGWMTRSPDIGAPSVGHDWWTLPSGAEWVFHTDSHSYSAGDKFSSTEDGHQFRVERQGGDTKGSYDVDFDLSVAS